MNSFILWTLLPSIFIFRSCMTHNLKILFAGTPDFAGTHLEHLIQAGCKIIAVFTQPDRPSGRGRKITASPVKRIAEHNNITVYQPDSLKSTDVKDQIIKLQPDLMVVIAYGLILPKDLLEIPSYGCVNVHASLLPRWRGAAPIQRAIEAGDKKTGVSLIQMDEGLDTGDIVYEAVCDILEDETSATLYKKLANIGAKALIDFLDFLASSNVTWKKQDSSQANYAHKITKEEARIDWSKDALLLERSIRAFNPSPVSWAYINGQRLRVWKAKALSVSLEGLPGEIVCVDSNGIMVVCGVGGLMLLEVQLPGREKKPVWPLAYSSQQLLTIGSVFN